MIVAAMSLVERVIPPPPFEDQVRDLGRACQLYNSYGIGAVRDPIVRRGTLQPGCLADIVGYRTDPITCPTDDLLHLRPAFTMVGGRAVYDPEAIL
jgi:predicted amidohydrolase YtcJ